MSAGPEKRPRIAGLLETALYVDDMARSARFFTEMLGLAPMLESERLTAFDAGAGGVLLVFARGGSRDDAATPGGTIPGHDGAGRLHMAFAIAAKDYDAWRARLADAGIAVTHEVTWPAGGRSLYFEDPDGHVLELATPGLWPNDGERPGAGGDDRLLHPSPSGEGMGVGPVRRRGVFGQAPPQPLP